MVAGEPTESALNLATIGCRERFAPMLSRKDLLMAFKVVVPIALVVALAGCGSFGAIGLPWKREKPVVQDPMTQSQGAPTGPVQTSNIGPPGDSTVAGLPADNTDAANQPLSPPTGAAMTAPAGSGANGGIGRTDLLGGWTITSGSDSCQLFMTLTSWTGGYRASTRGCTTDTLKSISAWSLQGSDVVLAGQGGTAVAHLTSSGNNRFDGKANGQGISFYR
jgi:predicted small lipoprotein YifL